MQAAFWWHLAPGQARKSMHTMEVCLRLPAAAQRLDIAMELTKTLLYVHEYPPDSHRGLDVASARILATVEEESPASAQRCADMQASSWLNGTVRAPDICACVWPVLWVSVCCENVRDLLLRVSHPIPSW